jgi:hypothetical protein
MIVFSVAAPANAAAEGAWLDMWAKVYAWDGSMGADGRAILTERNSGITYVVMLANSSATLEVLYLHGRIPQAGNALVNPVTATDFANDLKGNDMVSFRVDPNGATGTGVTVDLIVVDQVGGYTAFVEDFTVNDHSIVIDERPNIEHHGVAFILTTTSSTEIETGINFEKNSRISDMLIEVGTVFSGGAGSSFIDVGILSSGTNGDSDGFIYMAQLATAGYHSPFRPGINRTSYYISTAGEAPCFGCGALDLTMGTFLGNFDTGTEVTSLAGSGRGLFHREQLMIHGSWETSLTYTFGTAEAYGTTAESGWGLIHFWFTRIR